MFIFTYHLIAKTLTKISWNEHSTEKEPDSKQYLSQNISQMLMFVNVPVNLTIEKYKIDVPKNVPIIGAGKNIGNYYKCHSLTESIIFVYLSKSYPFDMLS